MGGCSIIILDFIILPILAIIFASMILWTILGIILIIISIIAKIKIKNKIKNGEEVNKGLKIGTNIFLIIGILCILPTFTIFVHSKIKTVSEETKFNKLYNKILVDQNGKWRDEGFILDDRKVIPCENIHIKKELELSLKKQLVGNIVVDENYNPYKGTSEIFSVENPGNFNVFIVDRDIFVYEDEIENIHNYYFDSKNQIAEISFDDENYKTHYYKCDFTLREANKLNNHYKVDKDIIIDKENSIKDYWSIIVKSSDGFYGDLVGICHKDGRYYLSSVYDIEGQHVYKLTYDEEQRIKNLIETFVNENNELISSSIKNYN